jgi:hypothetical protein
MKMTYTTSKPEILYTSPEGAGTNFRVVRREMLAPLCPAFATVYVVESLEKDAVDEPSWRVVRTLIADPTSDQMFSDHDHLIFNAAIRALVRMS